MASSNTYDFKTAGSAKRVIIMGGGIGGLIAAISLKRQLGFDNFTVYEQSDGIGGTWHHNTYPGCAADIGTHWYSLASDVDPNWDRTHVTQPTLLAYWRGLTTKYGVDKNISLHTAVTKVVWDEKNQVYHVDVQDTKTGETRTDYGNALVSAMGLLNVPHFSKELEGIRTRFKGAHFHSSRWDHSVDLHNKRVAVIGNGGSGCQFIPIIAQDPTTQIVNYCRSPGWFIPDLRSKVSKFSRWTMKYIPFVATLARFRVFFQHETLYLAFILFGKTSLVKALMALYIKSQTPKEYHKKIIPTDPVGCKRLVVDTGYLKALHQDNFDVNYDGVAEVSEHGITTKTGEYNEFDVIIEATGFVADEYPIPLFGIGGKSIQEYYREQGGPTAYIGTTAPGFPNFYTMLGPNMITGHGSVVYTEESQMAYALQFMEPVLKGWASSFNVTDKASAAFNTRLQNQLKVSVWDGCMSWYRAGHTGKVTSIWPGLIWTQWWWLKKPIWSDYEVTGGEEWKRRRRNAKLLSLLKNACFLAAAVYAGLNWQQVHNKSIDVFYHLKSNLPSAIRI